MTIASYLGSDFITVLMHSHDSSLTNTYTHNIIIVIQFFSINFSSFVDHLFLFNITDVSIRFNGLFCIVAVTLSCHKVINFVY